MAQMKMANVMEQLERGMQKSQEVKTYEEKRMRLDTDEIKEVEAYKRVSAEIAQGKDKDVKKLSKLDQVIASNEQLDQNIATYTKTLIGDLTKLGQFCGNLEHLTWKEWGLSWVPFFGSGLAESVMNERIEKADVKENLHLTLRNSKFTVEKLLERQYQLMAVRANIEASFIEQTNTLREAQPQYEHWMGEEARLTGEMEALKAEIDKANDTERAKIGKRLPALEKQLHEAQVNKVHYLAQVNNSTEAIEIHEKHMRAYSAAITGYEGLKTDLAERTKASAAIYDGLPTMVKAVLTAKAAAQVGKVLNVTTKELTGQVIRSADVISATATERMSKPNIDDSVMDAFDQFQKGYEARCKAGYEAIQAKLAKPRKAK